MIALGDVAVCFSNIIDENSNELYKGLSDRNLVVKKNTLMVLTHLILNVNSAQQLLHRHCALQEH